MVTTESTKSLLFPGSRLSVGFSWALLSNFGSPIGKVELQIKCVRARREKDEAASLVVSGCELYWRRNCNSFPLPPGNELMEQGAEEPMCTMRGCVLAGKAAWQDSERQVLLLSMF